VNSVAVYAPNWLGDSVMALPAIADVRRGIGGATLTIVSRAGVAPFFQLVPGVDRVMPIEGGVGSDVDAVILLPNSFHSALTAWRAGVPERWGYRTDWRGPLLTKGIPVPGRLHQVEQYRHLVSALGFENGPAVPQLPIGADIRAAGERQLRGAGWDGSRTVVALAPGSAYSGAKRWPAAHFAELASTLLDDGFDVVLVGGPGDVSVAREIELSTAHRASPSVRVRSLMGTDLPTLAGILSHCRAVVSNDSGPMHLAAALGVRVTALFGPTDERLTRPAGAGHAVLTNPVWCRPCMLRQCPIDHRCLRRIPATRAVAAVRQILQ